MISVWKQQDQTMSSTGVLPHGFMPPDNVISEQSISDAVKVYKPSIWLLSFVLMALGIVFFALGMLISFWMWGGIDNASALNADAHRSRGVLGMNKYQTLEMLGAVGGTTGRWASAAQRALKKGENSIKTDKSQQNAPSSSNNDVDVEYENDYADQSSNNLSSSLTQQDEQQTYTIQMGIFAARDNAVDLLQYLRAQGISGNIKTQENQSQKLYIVQSEEYQHFESADLIAQNLNERHGIAAMVISEPVKTKTVKK